ncbi:SusD/RagB family nutrient-binding outer membrane lipoprotein [Runella sp.]|uniref:SusD/RagB family nutrient-binding outer membrane lipoprotein n=1 Tax=Runella sp. TaxID=1960881 RepID=UPI003D137E9F
MKFIQNKNWILALTLGCLLFSCQDLTEIDKNPNSPEDVSSNYIMTYVLSNTGKTFFSLGRDGSKIGAAMQYMQAGTNEGAAVINQYAWTQEAWDGYYDILRNNQLIYDKGIRDNNRFFQAISLTMKSLIWGLLTDLYGDVPYSDALKASSGTFFPKYDEQATVYKGIMTDLKQAVTLLNSLETKDAVSATSDILYKGDGAKWRKFANSLRLRYALRLADKRSEMSTLGVNIQTEFTEAAADAFTAIGDDASMAFPGINADNSAPGGPLNASNPNYLLKPGKPFVDKLIALNDPRLQRWIQPVLRKWDTKVTKETTVTVKNIYGESYSVVYVPTTATNLDTSLYVGLPIGLPITQAVTYNKGNDATAYNNERSPYISFLHERYRKNTDTYVPMNFITYNEVEFILAEAALAGNFGATDAEGHYKKAIRGSMDKAGVFTVTYDFDKYYAQPTVSYASATNKLERIMEQKWLSSWFSIQSWFDWRRTGFPALKAGEVAQYGKALPIRFMYPVPNQDPSYLTNYNSAVERLTSTNFIPTGQSKDHPYAKMWLIQGTGKPWN